jgi:hypothetical protein
MVTIITAYTPNWKQLGEYTAQVWFEAAQRAGFQFRAYTFPSEAPGGLPPSWAKIALLLELNQGDLWWVDADTIPTSKLEANFSRTKISLYADMDGKGNCGVLYVPAGEDGRTNPSCRALLEELWALRFEFQNAQFWEQSALHSLIGSRGLEKLPLEFVQGSRINAFLIAPEGHRWKPGDMVAHVAGRDLSPVQKLGILKNLLRYLESIRASIPPKP